MQLCDSYEIKFSDNVQRTLDSSIDHFILRSINIEKSMYIHQSKSLDKSIDKSINLMLFFSIDRSSNIEGSI